MGGPLSAYPAPPDCLAAADGGSPRRRFGGYAACSSRANASAAPLILDDRAGRYRLDLVEHPERQRDAFVPDSETPVRVIHHLDRLACEPAREGRRVQQKHHPVIAQCEIAGELALLAPRQDLVKIVGLAQGAV